MYTYIPEKEIESERPAKRQAVMKAAMSLGSPTGINSLESLLLWWW